MIKVFCHNFNPQSNSGPNKFSRSLFTYLINSGQAAIANNQTEADVEFCLIQQQYHKVKPMLLRLDGIWFNSEQDYETQNGPIKYAYENADVVVFQSNFNKVLTEKWFGPHKNGHVIRNAGDTNMIENVTANYWDEKFDKSTEVWSCASSWRPHKRLNENIEYFLNFAPKNATLAIAGKNAQVSNQKIYKDKRIVFLGELDYLSLLSLYKRSSVFLHLAYLDHCPNVVVDAQAAGCHVICASSGGTNEVIYNGTIIVEPEWDFKPVKLYQPPKLDLTKCVQVKRLNRKTDIVNCAKDYYNLMVSISNKELL